MASIAKGGFPGKPRKKIHKKAVKFRKKLQKLGPHNVMQMCSFLNEANDQFQNIFDDDADQDYEFVGFSSEECGLCAYKRVSKPHLSPFKVTNDILGSNQAKLAKDKIVTRRSFALDSRNDNSVSEENLPCTTPVSVRITPIETPTFSKGSLSPTCAGSSQQIADSAFMKYKDTKLDFHRLSKKARIRESYEDCSAEEQAKRKDTSTASLKYASDIYLAQESTTLSSSKSPIKPATFIAPPPQNVAVKTPKSFKAGHQTTLEEKKKGVGHPDIMAKALLTRASRSLKTLSNNNSTSSTAVKSSRSLHGFHLPSKSVRSSRIIKANRRYMDDNISYHSRKSSEIDATDISEPVKKTEVAVDTLPEAKGFTAAVTKVEESKVVTPRKLILKPTRFQSPDENTPEAKLPDPKTKEKSKASGNEKPKKRSRSFIKRARFKHPTSSDALVLGTDSDKESNKSQTPKNPIREATFTAPTSRTRSQYKSKNSAELNDLGISASDWEKLYHHQGKKWILDSSPKLVPCWSRQEIHNILHGSHTFGTAWSSIARHYDFHEQHRDWISVNQKVKKCQNIGLLNPAGKVQSSVLLQLQPKLSKNPNVTVFTPAELKVRGLTANIPCSFAPARLRAFRQQEKKPGPMKILENALEVSARGRIFGTKLADSRWKKVKLRKIPKEDLYLGLSVQSMLHMLMPRQSTKTKERRPPWAPWEIHNVLHGIHYFGPGAWLTISAMYQFLDGHDNIDIRQRYKSVCCRGLILANDVRPDVLPKLHVVLSRRGKEYFRSKKIAVTICSLSKRTGRSTKTSRPPSGSPRIKQPDLEDEGMASEDLSISPARRAVHIFGSVPLWDDPVKAELIGPDDEAAPVINALESSLRQNLSASMSTRRASYDDVITSPSSKDVPCRSQSTKLTPEGKSKRSRSKSESQTTPVKSKVKGPRIKHVCRRASLVTGQPLATTAGDEFPHLTALPQKEREKIFAKSEKLKNADMSSDEGSRKPAAKPIVVLPAKKKSRKRHASRRCGNCTTCKEPRCQHCDLCRRIDSENSTSTQVLSCRNRKPCMTANSENNVPAKKSRKAFSSSQPGSRKSTRLQQQIAPLVAPPVVESLNLATVEAPPYLDATTLPYDCRSSPDSWADFSPFSKEIFDRLNSQSQSLIKTERWKGTYDHDLLWKNGGQALITSQPAPPRVVCLLCGSQGAPGEIIDRLIHCCSCCDSFHSYCADVNFEHPVVKKAMDNGTWLCKRCKLCSVCGASGKLMECRVCMKTFHSDCLGPTYPTKFTNNVWVCMQCITCKSCGAAKPGNLSGSRWTHEYTMCQKCGDLYDKGNYCSICQRCYSDEDYDCRMIQCAKCKRWIHSKCENLTVEMYTLLTHMPDSVQYKCPACDGRSQKLGEDGDIRDPSTKQVDVDRIRSSLSRLAPPLWRKLIEKDIQSGLETIIMCLFDHKATCSVLKKNESVSELNQAKENSNFEATRPRDLFAIRFAVHNQRYHSIGQFCSDVKNVIQSIIDETERLELEKIFKEESGKVFSWFNFETGKVKDNINEAEDVVLNALLPPHADHNYSQNLENTDSSNQLKSNKSEKEVEQLFPEPEDLRQCIFCSQYGDDMAKDCGRLLYCGQDEWAHVNCALWTAEVFEQHDGALKNVHSAASRGKMMKCDYCRMTGATVGCNTRDCPKNYHFPCARMASCAFQQDKKLYCRKHGHTAKSKLLLDDEFEVQRLVAIDNDETRPSRRWQRGIPANDITVTIGSSTVQELGRLCLSSDSENCLKPIAFRITRIFWSSVNAGKKTVYTITISESKSTADDHQPTTSQHNNNHTISHAVSDDVTPITEPVIKSPVTKPQPPPKRNSLVEIMESDPDIGPLSPTRRIAGAPLPPQERGSRRGGTYSIISSINRTLPQAITPCSNRLVYAASKETVGSRRSLLTTTPVKISPENPFLNFPAPKPVILSTSKTSTPTVEPILPNPDLAKLAPLPSQTEKRENLHASPSVSISSVAPNPDSQVAPFLSNNLVSSVDKKASDEKVEQKKSEPASQSQVGVKQGSSGSAILTSPHLPPGGSSSKQELEKLCPSLSKSLPSNPSKESSSQALVISPTQTSTKSSFLNTAMGPKTQNTSSKPAPVISLIQGARNAVSVEKQVCAKIVAPSKFSSPKKPKSSNVFEQKLVSKQQKRTSKATVEDEFCVKSGLKIISSPRKGMRGRRKSMDYSEQKMDKIFEEFIADDTTDCAIQHRNTDICKFPSSKTNFHENLTPVPTTVISARGSKPSQQCSIDNVTTHTSSKTETSSNSTTKVVSISANNSSTPTSSRNNNVQNYLPLNSVDSDEKPLAFDEAEEVFSPTTPSALKTSLHNLKAPSVKETCEEKTQPSSSVDQTEKDCLIANSKPLDDSANLSDSTTPEISDAEDEEPAFRRKKLRNFALKSPKLTSSVSLLTTRSRSKSFEPQTHVITTESVTKTPVVTSNNTNQSQPVSDSGNGLDNTPISEKAELDSTRRYPRRNTYTCLKSFSGLSPNYALASYSHEEKSRKPLRKRGRPKKCSVSTVESLMLESNSPSKLTKQSTSKSPIKLKKDVLKSSASSTFGATTETQNNAAQNAVNDNILSETANTSTTKSPNNAEQCAQSTIFLLPSEIDEPNVNSNQIGTEALSPSRNNEISDDNTSEAEDSAIFEENFQAEHSENTVETQQSMENDQGKCTKVFNKNTGKPSEAEKQPPEEDLMDHQFNRASTSQEKKQKKIVTPQEPVCITCEAGPQFPLDGATSRPLNEAVTSLTIPQEKCFVMLQKLDCPAQKTNTHSTPNGALDQPFKDTALVSEAIKLASLDSVVNSSVVTEENSVVLPRTPSVFSENVENSQLSIVSNLTTTESKDGPSLEGSQDSSSLNFDSDFKPLSDDTIDSIEELRGGADDSPLSRLNGSIDPIQDSLTESPASRSNPNLNLNPSSVVRPSTPMLKLGSIPSNISSTSTPTSNIAPFRQNFGPVSILSGKINSATSETYDYPVLSADDVKTILENSDNLQADKQPTPPNSVPQVISRLAAPVAAPCYTPVLKTIQVQQPLTTTRLSKQGRKKGNKAPHPRFTRIPIGPNSPLVPPVNIPAYLNPSAFNIQSVPIVPTQPPALTSLHPPPIQNPLPVPYSMRATMAMTSPANPPTKLSLIHNNNPLSGQNMPPNFQQGPPAPPMEGKVNRPNLSQSSSSSYLQNSLPPLQNLPINIVETTLQSSILKHAPTVLCPPSLTDMIAPSEVQTPPLVPLPDGTPSARDLSSLEHLIDFYSAKNKLSAEEKDIVRSIITSQIKTNQGPSPSRPQPVLPPLEPLKKAKTTPTTTTANTGTSKKAPTTNKKRSSRDKSVKPSRKRRKEKLVAKKDFDEIEDAKQVVEAEERSYLYEIYEKRRKIAEKRNKTVEQAMAAYDIFLDKPPSDKNKENRLPVPDVDEFDEPKLVYEIKSEDGYFAKGTDLEELINQLLTSIHDCWLDSRFDFPPISLHSIIKAHDFMCLSHDAVRFLVEQLPGARHCPKYKAKYHKLMKIKEGVSHINPHGCCRAEQYKGRAKPDMFGFLASKHRLPPEYMPDKSQCDDMLQFSNRRATSMEMLPMAMRFRHIRTFSKQAVGVYRSSIHGRGLYCKRDIDAGEMIMEYTGQMIRKNLTDKREQYYESKSIGCYMFRMDDLIVVDATVMGSAARFINHSCEPNCYSRIVHVEGKKHIVIFALRKIYRGEELTYDYKFPIEDENHKIACNCGSKQCRKFMN